MEECKSKNVNRSSELSASIPDRGLYSEAARLNRLRFLRESTGLNLESLEETRIEADSLRGNIENMIGTVEIPIGVAGPLLVNRQNEEALLYAPIATTEGALVSSISRGARAASLCGGITARAIRQRMTRAPMFELESIDHAIRFAEKIQTKIEVLREITRKHSNFSQLIELDPVVVARTVHLRFVYETGDAAGQNMTTVCTANACEWLLREFSNDSSISIVDFALEGNLSTDKKVSYRSAISGRGTQVVAECAISRKVLMEVLKVTPEQVLRIYYRGTSAALYSGILGFNINVANVVAGIFTATGQDIASVHESSTAQLHFEPRGDDLYASLTMPNLIVGTVGGGTRLKTQGEMLELLGCRGENGSARLAEAICAFALALELSTTAAIVGGQFAKSHERLGRSKEKNWLKRDQLKQPFFQSIIESRNPETRVLSVIERPDFKMGDSLVVESASQVTKRLCGIFSFELDVTENGARKILSVVVKAKPIDQEVILATEMMGSLCGESLARAYRAAKAVNPFVGCHIREIKLYEQTDRRFTDIAPVFYGAISDDRSETYVLMIERLENLSHFDSADLSGNWDHGNLAAAIEGIAGFHSIHLGREGELANQDWIGPIVTAKTLTSAGPLWESLALHGRTEFAEWFTEDDFENHLKWMRSFQDYATSKTLIHGDFNSRNIALRQSDTGETRLCAYDWELATIHVPQRDLVELLSFTLGVSCTGEELLYFIEQHRHALERRSGRSLGAHDWLKDFKRALEEFMVTRLAMYFVAHTHRHCAFLPRVYRTARHLHALLERMGV